MSQLRIVIIFGTILTIQFGCISAVKQQSSTYNCNGENKKECKTYTTVDSNRIESTVIGFDENTTILSGNKTLTGFDGRKIGWRRGDLIYISLSEWDGGNEIDCSSSKNCTAGLISGGNICIAKQNPYQAMRFIERIFRSAFVASGCRFETKTLNIRATTGEEAYKAISKAYGFFGKKTSSGLFIFSSEQFEEHDNDTGFAEASKKNRTIDLDFTNVHTMDVLKVLSKALRMKLSGRLNGTVSLVGRNIYAHVFANAVLTVLRAKWRIEENHIHIQSGSNRIRHCSTVEHFGRQGKSETKKENTQQNNECKITMHETLSKDFEIRAVGYFDNRKFLNIGDISRPLQSGATITGPKWMGKDEVRVIFNAKNEIKILEYDGKEKRNERIQSSICSEKNLELK